MLQNHFDAPHRIQAFADSNGFIMLFTTQKCQWLCGSCKYLKNVPSKGNGDRSKQRAAHILSLLKSLWLILVQFLSVKRRIVLFETKRVFCEEARSRIILTPAHHKNLTPNNISWSQIDKWFNNTRFFRGKMWAVLVSTHVVFWVG